MVFRHVLVSVLSLAIGLGALSCGSPTAEQTTHTLLARFARPTTGEDVAALGAMGTSDVRTIRIINALSFRTGRTADVFTNVGGVVRVEDLGTEQDPEVSVFITVATEPTDVDFEFLNSLPTARVPGFLGGSIIAAVMRLSDVDRLREWSRFVDVEVSANTNRVGV